MPDGCNYVEEASKWMLMGIGALVAQVPEEQFEEWVENTAHRVAYLAEKIHEQIHPEDSDAAAGDPQVLQPPHR